ncbi:MAG: ATP-grasp domain-containing protein, partial [Pseudomonadota bacterium]|nr:ATP-grasp domain-containing protein [Pseudomonadota bacterium]
MRRLLVANRGEIARRILRTAHRMGVETVAVYSDADAQALHVREATASHALGGNASADCYLCIDKLVAAARACGADAAHPGYGFLSENADFAQAVLDAGMAWVGPPPAAMRVLGNKVRAKELASACGVPCLPGAQRGDQSDRHFSLEAKRIGFPLMVKAAAGGGGRGIRLVTAAHELPAALQSARSEALAAFGSGELLLERALLQPRHVEVQVFADAHGHCIHLGERDCSVQRRHQKLIEETPGPALDGTLRRRMTQCAIDLARATGYVGAGTVEFLLSPDDGAFYFLEMNTRLQVEHPVTEMVTGLDLVELMIRVAAGEPLPFGQDDVTLNGWAIENRVYAEDPYRGFLPSTGRLVRYRPPAEVRDEQGATRVDDGVVEGGEVSMFYDPMIAKLVTWAPTREGAIDRQV